MKRGEKGFTLIELVMVIVILAVLAAVLIPRYINLRKDAEESVARHFGGVLKEAYNIYLARLVVEDPNNPASPPDPDSINSFGWFVGYSDASPSTRNTVTIDDNIRALLATPGANVGSNNDKTITFNFKSGATATYVFNETNNVIEETYTNF